MLRPWMRGTGTCDEDHFSLGDVAWKRRTSAARLSADAPPCAALTQAQTRKLRNLFAAVRRAAHTPMRTARALTSHHAPLRS
jgi:hypothetical protein